MSSEEVEKVIYFFKPSPVIGKMRNAIFDENKKKI